MTLNFGMTFPQLSTRDGLLALDQRFLDELGFVCPDLLHRLRHARHRPDDLNALHESTLLIALGPYVENFIAKLFKIEARVAGLKLAHHELASLHAGDRQVAQPAAAQKIAPEEPAAVAQKTLTASGHAIAALAMMAVDNPIYPKQDAHNIPASEARSFKDVLELPYGFEIYSLLTRWNPLDLRRRIDDIAGATDRRMHGFTRQAIRGGIGQDLAGNRVNRQGSE